MSRKKLGINLAASSLLIGGAWLYSPSPLLSLKSPGGRYSVEVVKQLDYPAPLYMTARLTAGRDGVKLVSRERIHEWDFLDCPFLTCYGDHVWLSESVLRFGHEKFFANPQNGTVTVTNNTDRPISYLDVRAGRDIFMLFDLPPRGTQDLPFQMFDEWATVGGRGRFDDGTSLRWVGTGFNIGEERDKRGRFFVTVEDGGIRIESPRFEKYR